MTALEMTKNHVCAGCGAEKAVSKRLPRGWKRKEQLFCPACWGERYLLRAVTFGVAAPLDATWKELDQALHGMFAMTTSCANWMTTKLALSDNPRLPGDTKLGKMPPTYLYPEARRLFPSLPSQSVAAIEQAVTRRYRARRYDAVWTHRAVLPTFRYPQPFPVHNQSWSPEFEGESPVISVRIGDRRYRLRLKGGARYRRQLYAFRQMTAEEAQTGQLDLYRTHDGQLLAKLVAWLPRPPAESAAHGVLTVRTDPASLLLAVNLKDERIWVYHADQVPRWVAEHRAQLQRWADDTKAEARPVPAFSARREAASRKFHDRMKTACYQAAAYVGGYAKRRHFAAVNYDDQERRWCAEFPWEMLRSRLATVLDGHEIEFTIVKASAGEKGKNGAALAEREEHEES